MEKLRASGPGWQTRADAALREWIESQPKRRRAQQLAGDRFRDAQSLAVLEAAPHSLREHGYGIG